jgi:hypothetical protein
MDLMELNELNGTELNYIHLLDRTITAIHFQFLNVYNLKPSPYTTTNISANHFSFTVLCTFNDTEEGLHVEYCSSVTCLMLSFLL